MHDLVGEGEVLSFRWLAGVDGYLVAAVAGDKQAGASGRRADRPGVVTAHSAVEPRTWSGVGPVRLGTGRGARGIAAGRADRDLSRCDAAQREDCRVGLVHGSRSGPPLRVPLDHPVHRFPVCGGGRRSAPRADPRQHARLLRRNITAVTYSARPGGHDDISSAGRVFREGLRPRHRAPCR